MCPLARSNGGTSSSTAAFMAVVTSASISAVDAGAAPDTAISAAAAAAITNACIGRLPSWRIESLGLEDRRRRWRAQRRDQRPGGFGVAGAGGDAGRIDRGELQLRRQHADHLDVRVRQQFG